MIRKEEEITAQVIGRLNVRRVFVKNGSFE
jgi:hypothetical protein